jgi:hypothetical protein
MAGTMTFVFELLLFVTGFLLGLWYTSLLGTFWRGGFNYLEESGGFNAGDALGYLVLIANALLSALARNYGDVFARALGCGR